MSSKPLRLGYLVSMYPAVSHTFILREVMALRERGILVEVSSINDAPPRSGLTSVERSEADSTLYVKRMGPSGALRAGLWLLLHRPIGIFRGLRAALTLAGSDVGKLLLCSFYYAEAIILAKWMHERSLTHLHVHFATPAATVALILTHLAPVTMSMTVHGPDEFYDVPGYFLPQKITRARFVICISFFAQSQLMNLSSPGDWRKLEIARLGVDLGHFLPRPFRTSPECFQILCVGRLVGTKGQSILVEAVSNLLDSGRRIQLRFVGDGPDRNRLELLVREKGLATQILFEGSVNQDRIQDFYAATDIFALASFAEGIPVVLMEAMAMEICCVATSINGIPELIRNEVDGLLVPPSDIEGMAVALTRLMDDPELRRSLGQAGRMRVQQKYEISASADRLAEIFSRRLGDAL